MSLLDTLAGAFGRPMPAAPAPVVPAPAQDSILADAEKRIALREGKRLDVYLDSLGILTVGRGHRVTAFDHLKLGDVITDARCESLFAKDLGPALAAAHLQAEQAGITDPSFIAALCAVNFQCGTKWTQTFFGVWKFIMAGQYEAAAVDAGGTKWAKQTPVRVSDFQAALRALPAKA